MNDANAAARPNIHLHIEQLTLHGFALPNGGHADLAGSVERELSRLLNDEGLPATLRASGGHAARLDAGSFDVRAGAHSDEIGARVALALYESLKGGSE